MFDRINHAYLPKKYCHYVARGFTIARKCIENYPEASSSSHFSDILGCPSWFSKFRCFLITSGFREINFCFCIFKVGFRRFRLVFRRFSLGFGEVRVRGFRVEPLANFARLNSSESAPDQIIRLVIFGSRGTNVFNG